MILTTALRRAATDRLCGFAWSTKEPSMTVRPRVFRQIPLRDRTLGEVADSVWHLSFRNWTYIAYTGGLPARHQSPIGQD